MTTRIKLLVNVVAVFLAVAALAYVHTVVNKITATFIEIRVADANFFTKLVRENWDGIKTVPDEKKKVLLQSLDSSLAGADLRFMRVLVLVSFYCLIGGFIVDRIVASVKLLKSAHGSRIAP